MQRKSVSLVCLTLSFPKLVLMELLCCFFFLLLLLRFFLLLFFDSVKVDTGRRK